jgi:hypothetical protein
VNVDELRHALDDLAGPAPDVTDDARRSVRSRVRRAGLRRVTAVGVVVVVVVGGGVALATRTDRGPSVDTPPAHADVCTPPRAVVSSRVPADVVAWADGPVPTSTQLLPHRPHRAVLGEGAIWTVRSATAVPGTPLEGHWLVKFPWFTRPSGVPRITGRRLDGPGTFTGDANVARDENGTFVTSSLIFSDAGCWKVTARYRGSTLTFPIRVGGG